MRLHPSGNAFAILNNAPDFNTRSLLAVDVEKREIIAKIAFDKTPYPEI
jgi:hypothetical protein